MYAIEESERKINGVEIVTFQRDVVEGDAILEAEDIPADRLRKW